MNNRCRLNACKVDTSPQNTELSVIIKNIYHDIRKQCNIDAKLKTNTRQLRCTTFGNPVWIYESTLKTTSLHITNTVWIYKNNNYKFKNTVWIHHRLHSYLRKFSLLSQSTK